MTVKISLIKSKISLIKSKISLIKPAHISKIKVTKKQAIEIAKEVQRADKYPMQITNAVLKKGRFYKPFYWKVTFIVPPEHDWKGYVYINAISGNAFNPVAELV